MHSVEEQKINTCPIDTLFPEGLFFQPLILALYIPSEPGQVRVETLSLAVDFTERRNPCRRKRDPYCLWTPNGERADADLYYLEKLHRGETVCCRRCKAKFTLVDSDESQIREADFSKIPRSEE